MKNQIVRRGTARGYRAGGVVATFLFGGCGSPVHDGSKDTCLMGECQSSSGVTADGGRTMSSQSGQTSTADAGSANDDPIDSGTVDDGVVDSGTAQMSATTLDGGKTCSDGDACASGDGPESGSNTSDSANNPADSSANDAASDGVGKDAAPSHGCSLGNATPTSSLEHFRLGTTVTLPEAYDGTTPLPIVLALHASGMQREMGTNFPADHPLRKNFIVVTPMSDYPSGALEVESDQEFAELLSDLQANLCFDTGRFFSVGHASGGRAASKVSTRGHYQFRAAAFVGAFSGVGAAIPTLFVHATEDHLGRMFQDVDGSKAAARFASENGCSSETVEYSIADSEAESDTADCVDYQGCTQSVRWCSFEYVQTASDFEYWPSFASDLIYDHFVSILGRTQ